MTRLRVGVIGLGEVAQIVHLPILESRPELFEIAALCDASPQLLQALGDRYHVSRDARYQHADELVTHPLDAVMVLTSDEYHADCVIAACRSERHVFVEKPVCLTLREAEAVRAAQAAAGVEIMVGYMRRYAPAFELARQEFGELGPINHMALRDLIGRNRLLIDQSSTVLRPTDITTRQHEERSARADAALSDVLGETSDDVRRAYRLLLGLASHDTSAMRELVGYPSSVVAARQWGGGNHLSVLFDYGRFCATLDVGVDEQKRFDASIEVQGQLRSLRIQYQTPYLRQLPTTLEMARTVDQAHIESSHRPTFKDAYVFELEAFHEMVASRQPAKTTVDDAMEDLRLAAEIVTEMRRDASNDGLPTPR